MLTLTSCTVLLLLISAPQAGAQVNRASGENAQGTKPSTQERSLHTNKGQGPDYNVNVTSVIERSTLENKALYQVTYSYEFKGRGTVYIKGLGTAPAKGKFRYMTSDRQLEFRESATGPVIVTVQLEETTRTMGANSTELPNESDFPQFFRSSTWAPPATFPEAASRVIQKYFLSGYNPRQGGQVHYYVTTYRTLEVTDRNLRSQIAVSISQPYDSSGDRFIYRVQFIARDRPRLSSTWRYGDERSQLTITAAQEFINNLIAELTASGGRQQ